jgi:hypothetical protein
MTEVIATFALKAYTILLPIAWIGVAIMVLVLIPMAFFNKTRSFASVGLFCASYLFGATTWFLGAGITFVTYGWFGLLLGLLLFGVGVVPVGIAGAYFRLDSGEMAISLLAMSAVTYMARVGAMMLFDSLGKKE